MSRTSIAILPSSNTLYDPWEPFTRPGAIEAIGIETFIEWISIITRAGVNCPIDVCAEITQGVTQRNVGILYRKRFAEVLLRSTFSRSASVVKILDFVCRINKRDLKDEANESSMT
jgi:hypothetical protein